MTARTSRSTTTMQRINIERAEERSFEDDVHPLGIMLLGKSKAGKSSTGNTILGRNVFRSGMLLPAARDECQMEVGTVNDVRVAVIDTPGFLAADTKTQDTMQVILKFLRRNQPGPCVFVLVMTLGRMTQEDIELQTVIEEHFGSRVWDYTIILFTHGDDLENKTIYDIIAECDENQRAFFRKCNSSFHVFNNKQPEDRNQVTKFMEKIQMLVAVNGRDPYPIKLSPEEEREIWEQSEECMKNRGCDEERAWEHAEINSSSDRASELMRLFRSLLNWFSSLKKWFRRLGRRIFRR